MRPEVEQELAHVLLTELLAYQFASPVRWIETQDVILSQYNAERIVEVGPSPTLAGMASRTLKAKYESYDAALSLQRQVLCYSKDTKEIYYTPDPEAPAAEGAADAATPATPAPVAAPVAVPAASAAPTAAAQAVDDTPVKAVQVLHALVAQKIKKSLADVPLSKAIKDLVGGKSTVQNEILGDLGKEFGATPEKPEETPLSELAEQFQDSFNGQLGKVSSSLVARFISSKMPGGFSITSARKYLSTRWGLGQGRQDAVFLMCLTDEPKARLGDEASAKAYFDGIAQKYGASQGIDLSAASAGGAGAGGAAGGAVVDSAALDEVNKKHDKFVRQQMEVYARYLKIGLRDGEKQFVAQKEATALLQKELDLWLTEHGEFYAQGIKPVFSPLKARTYDSYWNWARQDCLTMFYDIIFGRLSTVDREIVAKCISIMNRANPTLIDFMQYYIDHVPTSKGHTYALAQELSSKLLENCKEALEAQPVYKDVTYPTGPQTTLGDKGEIEYKEVVRPSVRKLENYVTEMATGMPDAEAETEQDQLAAIYKTLQAKLGNTAKLDDLFADVTKTASTDKPHIPFLHLKSPKSQDKWEMDRELTSQYLAGLESAAREGLTFEGKVGLVTGAGMGSIGADILQGLLSGGAKVVVTTSRYSREVTEYYQAMYTKYGSRGSTLTVVPFNQASATDVRALVEYIYDPKTGLGDVDFVVPFAAIPENGIELDGIDSRSELAHRMMLTNVLRLIGAIKSQKMARGFDSRPAQVILPLSPNHGTFGADGLYSESKLALETLFNRWHSESWGSYLTICGAIIGWTRGTGLMSQNNIIAEGIEKLGVRTFSQKEMAFNILGLMSRNIVQLCQERPMWADLNGGLHTIENLKTITQNLRKELIESSELRKAVALETSREHRTVKGANADLPFRKAEIEPRANHRFEFPGLKSYEDLRAMAPELQGALDPEKVVVVTGFAEVGPWGNARTRWDMEANGTFSLEGAIEMAWIMGLIKHHNGPLKGKPYAGWVDTKTGEPVDDKDVKAKYEQHILDHSGIRLIEPELFNGYDPNRKQMLQEIIVESDLEPFECSKEAAEQFMHEQGDKVEAFEEESGSGQWTVRFLKGATVYVPKALKFDRLVAGQVPTGWDAKRYGVPDDIISQVDPITLYVLVCTVEALVASGVTDPYEFYKYVHVSEVGNCSGSGMGGVSALRGMFKDRYLDKPVQNDILQESFINTMSAWVNMLLLSSSGPIKTPVGACATAIESVDSGYELIQSGRARIVIVGGYDDFQEEGSHEFGNMNATSNAVTEMSHGRTPREMSRPNTSTRSGFMESQGSGIQILMNAKLAIEMGVPIYGIVAMTATATDKIGRSVPAPGKGVMTAAREHTADLKHPYRILDIKYRKRQIALRKKQIAQWVESEIENLHDEEPETVADADYYAERVAQIQNEGHRQTKEALATWGNDFYKNDARISGIRGSLAVFGLTVDDIGVSSFHGTSTKANDKNESAAINAMLNHLGRSKGNPVLGIFQKYLTGHPKGAAGAWMLNGILQVLNSGLVPGNRNADNIDEVLKPFDKIVYPAVSIQTDGLKAATVTSFGFGQKGAFALVIHPDYVLATLDKSQYEIYQAKVAKRYNAAYQYTHKAMAQNSLFAAKDKAPYTDDQEQEVYLNPLARVSQDKKSKALVFAKKIALASPNVNHEDHTQQVLGKMTSSLTAGSSANVGVDAEDVSAINIENQTFLDKNFTEAEQAYCFKAPSPQASFAGTWSAKEAVFKALNVESKGAGAELKSIEILRDAKGAPYVNLTGSAKDAGAKYASVKVSISHSDSQAVAVAICE